MMEQQEKAVNLFVCACNDMIRSNFILAKSKLAVVFKTIAASEEIKKFFEEVVDGYQFKMAKTKCFSSTFDGRRLKQIILLPENPREKVAFLFCLLVEINKDKIDIVIDKISFDAFLMRFFGSEGDFEKSYIAFCEQIMIPFRNTVYDAFMKPFQFYDYQKNGVEETPISKAEEESSREQIFSEPKVETQEDILLQKRKAVFEEEMLSLLEQEKLAVEEIDISPRQCGIALHMLGEICRYVKAGEIATVKAILWGYHYLLLYCKYSSESLNKMYECIAAFEEK